MGHACRYSFGSLLLAAKDILIAEHVHAVGVYSMYLDIFVKMRCTFSFTLYHNIYNSLSSMNMLCIFYFPVLLSLCCCCYGCCCCCFAVTVYFADIVVLVFSSSQNIPLSGFPVHTQHLVSNPPQLWVGIPVEPSKAA